MKSADDSAESEIIQLSIIELQKKCDQINSAHDQLRVRVLAMLTVVIALATYVFTNIHLDRMSGPEKFLFGFGSMLLVLVFIILLLLTSTRNWEMAVEVKEIERAYSTYKSKLKYLRYIQGDYLEAVKGNTRRVAKTGYMFNISIYLLVISAIIILALKR